MAKFAQAPCLLYLDYSQMTQPQHLPGYSTIQYDHELATTVMSKVANNLIPTQRLSLSNFCCIINVFYVHSIDLE